MKEKFEVLGGAGLGIIGLVFSIVVFAFLVNGGVWLFENFHELFQTISNWVFLIVLVLVVASLIPTIRAFTGVAIAYLTLVWGLFFWLFCLFITYELWGFLGVFFGLVFAGVGVFATAFFAVLFEGEFALAFFTLLNLAIIYFVRMLGYWIASKHKETNEERIVLSDETVIESDNLSTPRMLEEKTGSLYCGACGNGLITDSQFCSKCGARI